MIRATRLLLFATTVGCGLIARVDDQLLVEAGVDATKFVVDAGVADGCEECGASLEIGCGPNSQLDCPPALDAPGFFAWAQERANQLGTRTPLCVSMTTCPEHLMIIFPEGTDCSQSYLFDPTTRQLIAVLHSCDSFILTRCQASDICLPSRCVPNEGIVPFNSSPQGCPALPEAISDASAPDGD